VYQERKKQALRSKIKAIGERDNKKNMEMFNCTVVLNNTIQLNKKIENIIINNGQAS
jgi:hypothetical protein